MSFSIIPEETALLVIDAQNGMCHPKGTLAKSGVDVGPLQAILDPIAEVVRACQEAGIPDIWTRQEHYAEDKSREAHRIQHHTRKRVNIACQKGTWDAEIVDELKPFINEKSHVIGKQKFSGFYGTNLEVLLRILGVRLLVFTGTTTNLCIETTLRDAYMRDYDCVIVGDCVAGVNPEWHRVSLEVWRRYMGLVVTHRELLHMLPSRVSS
ncbi:MAG: cysteine hydrolase family protein [Nitrospinota bacterium]